MMTTRLVYRLLDADGELLGWTEDMAEARGDGALRASRPIMVPIERVGLASQVSIHWVDVNVETRVPLLLCAHVVVGATVTVFQAGQIVVVVGTSAGGLPPVTVRRAVTIGVPVGAMAAIGNR